jgi:hypothetical protein
MFLVVGAILALGALTLRPIIPKGGTGAVRVKAQSAVMKLYKANQRFPRSTQELGPLIRPIEKDVDLSLVKVKDGRAHYIIKVRKAELLGTREVTSRFSVDEPGKRQGGHPPKPQVQDGPGTP